MSESETNLIVPRSNDADQAPELQLNIGGQMVSIDQLAKAFGDLTQQEQIVFLQRVVQNRAEFEVLYSAFVILATETNFDNPDKVTILENTATKRSFARYLKDRKISPENATRKDLIDWWSVFMKMANMNGYAGQEVDLASTGDNLWLATRNLSLEMQADPKSYDYLPGQLANHLAEVSKILERVEDARAFLTLLMGESWKDMQRSPAFMKAFLPTEIEIAPEEIISEVIYHVSILLKTGK